MADRVDILIVGGGPAGQAAALTLADLGVAATVVDEQPRPGGQILRQPPKAFRIAGWMEGGLYADLRRQLARFEDMPAVDWRGGRSVLGLARSGQGGFTVTLSSASGVETIEAARVLVAAGCQDLAVPLPGWTLPGVYAAGGVQAFLKSQRLIPGERLLFAGTHPLQMVIAAQVVEAGGAVEAVLFAQQQLSMVKAVAGAPLTAAAHLGNLLAAAGAMQTLRRHGVPVRYGVPIGRILGERSVEGVEAGGRTWSCDAVGLCFGFVPQSALPRMIGARMRQAGPAGGWAALHDRWMRSTVPGLFVAGETTGVAGAPAAMAAGEVAGAGIALDMRLLDEAGADRLASAARSRREELLRFAALLDRIADPRRFFPAMEPDTLVCRCEDVPLGRIEQLLDGRSANAIKLSTRCGMGACQGRNCEPTLLRLIGNANDSGFAARFPARPITIADLAAPPLRCD
ncbi:NAD(P)/FAD-dependent oxidoreductase [Rhizorhabdus phycosphaerae]|uniref:FAD/NAD(P)-dependent oxidoreductase n=1 Tax=Rhizorhabdus phycosphaerae TaxID=2711156 RepID=UPI0013EC7941|nr:NAD(P)/FAD-dependent oxidoreductase [Rhizorhabdus phycosphaerae]